MVIKTNWSEQSVCTALGHWRQNLLAAINGMLVLFLSLSFSLLSLWSGYFSPRRGCPTALKMFMGLTNNMIASLTNYGPPHIFLGVILTYLFSRLFWWGGWAAPPSVQGARSPLAIAEILFLVSSIMKIVRIIPWILCSFVSEMIEKIISIKYIWSLGKGLICSTAYNNCVHY